MGIREIIKGLKFIYKIILDFLKGCRGDSPDQKGEQSFSSGEPRKNNIVKKDLNMEDKKEKKIEQKYKNKTMFDSFNAAIEGIFDTIRTEKNMKFHAFITVVILMLALFYDLSKSSILALSISIVLVWVAELLNTAIEACIDIFCEDYHDLAKKAKDASAGAVLLTALNAVIVGYIVFSNLIKKKLSTSFMVLKTSYQHKTVFIFIIVLTVIILLKLIFKKGTPLRGGIPSGHSALAGSIFMLITYLTDSSKIFFLTLIMLILVLQSRVEGKIHTFFETIAGGVLGIAITYGVLIILNWR